MEGRLRGAFRPALIFFALFVSRQKGQEESKNEVFEKDMHRAQVQGGSVRMYHLVRAGF
ncbi:hypothetical protein AB1275_39300 [Streptomyces tanashiensis]|uniref:hypothetical protein n=1 Tax=Streptomyces tanashiensis TaxID=67367 RepID=UPI003464C9EC